MLCIVKRVILKKRLFKENIEKYFELTQPPMLKALIKIGGQMLEGSSPPTPSGCALKVFHGLTRARFVVKLEGVSTECLTKLEGVNYNLGLKKP